MNSTNLPEPLRSLSQDEIKKAATMLAMVEAVCRPEPMSLSPELASLLKSRKPSEIPGRITEILVDGLFMEAELQARKADILASLMQSGIKLDNAEAFFNEQLFSRKWGSMGKAFAKGAAR